MSENIENIKTAIEKGYIVDDEGKITFDGRERKLNLCTKGYPNFTIRVDGGKTRRIWVHMLQAHKKFGDKIFDKNIEIRHLDGIRHNNSIDNIAIGSHSENMNDIPKEIRLKNAINASYQNRKFDDETVKKILKDREDGFTYKMLTEKYKVGKSTLSFLFNKSLYANT